MSIKSLLQIILFLLILMIIGSIYFVYFYTQPIEKDGLKELNKESVINSQNENLEFPDEEVSKNSKSN